LQFVGLKQKRLPLRFWAYEYTNTLYKYSKKLHTKAYQLTFVALEANRAHLQKKLIN